jgi:hypothetical protein
VPFEEPLTVPAATLRNRSTATKGVGQAGGMAGIEKSTISRATGKLSLAERNGATFQTDPAELANELARVFSNKREVLASNGAMGSATGARLGSVADATRVMALEAELQSMRALLAEVSAERDRWHAQAQAVALLMPPRRRRWWRNVSRL